MKYTCPCCGYKTLDEQPPGTYDICHVCFWEDDNSQFDNPDIAGGANTFSLRQCQQNFREYGACDERCRSFVQIPGPEDVKDPDWTPLPPEGMGLMGPLRPAKRAKAIFHLPGPTEPAEEQ